MVTSTLNKKIFEVVTMQVFRSGVFDRSEKKVVGGLKTAWEIGGIETEQGRMVLQRCGEQKFRMFAGRST